MMPLCFFDTKVQSETELWAALGGAAGKSKIETNILKGPQNLHLLQCSVPPSELLAAAAPFNSTSVRYNCNSAQYEDNFEV